jgi:hypothetical protein
LKKVLFFILSIIYFTTSTGADIHFHYCMGNLADWSIWIRKEEKECGKCGMIKEKSSNGCCTDEHKWIKIQDEQKNATGSYLFNLMAIAEPIAPCLISSVIDIPQINEILPGSHAPPIVGKIALYKINSIFLI